VSSRLTLGDKVKIRFCVVLSYVRSPACPSDKRTIAVQMSMGHW